MSVKTSIIVMSMLVAALVSANHAAVREAAVPTEIPSVKGDIKVFYELQTNTEEKPTNASDVLCSAIEFHPEYVILKYKTSGGRLIPIKQISSFRWEGGK